MILSLVIFSKFHEEYQKWNTRVNLLSSMSVMRPGLFLLHIRKAIRKARDLCLQQQSECYLHLAWKGPRFRHQHHRYRTRARSPSIRRGLQVSHQVLFLFMMMRQLQIQRRPNIEGLPRSKKQTFKPWKSSWRWPNGTSASQSREISSFKPSMQSWSSRTFVRIAKLPDIGGLS